MALGRVTASLWIDPHTQLVGPLPQRGMVTIEAQFTAAVTSTVQASPAPTTTTFSVGTGLGASFVAGLPIYFGPDPSNAMAVPISTIVGDVITLPPFLQIAPVATTQVTQFVPVDPTTVLFAWDMPASNPVTTKVTTTYSGSSSGGPPAIVKVQKGVYQVALEPINGPGPLRYRVEGTGTAQCVKEGQFDVALSPLA